ncbi:MAG: DNA mismatch repair endonuclease MutL [Nitrospinae bacterium]|nr:DNA mismatch repair endonuclease MutL [Nitrospinota bacterium]
MSGSIIRVLPEDLANKIAAGEVVERPASVVKELVENSVDAGAGSIAIDLENGGKRLIHIQDDGSGMNRDDALLAFERHATSKIRANEDLFNIRTLGFRGEALPSIAAVSKVLLTTSTGEPGQGQKLCIEGGALRDVKAAAHPKGTSLMVRQLFFNTPARRKFLKTDQTELSHISNTVMRQALARPDISFRINHNGRNLVNAPAHSQILPRIMDLFGRDLVSDLVPVQFRKNGFGLDGYVSKPHCHRVAKDALFFYVNGRYVKDRVVTHAVLEAFRGLLPKERVPMAFLYLEISPGSVDVNVHPSKTEVRFAEQSEVHSFISQSIKEGLKSGGGKHAPAEAARKKEASVAPEVREQTAVLVKDKTSYVPLPFPPAFPFTPRREYPAPATQAKYVQSRHIKGPGEGSEGLKSTPVPAPRLMDASSLGYSDFRTIGQIDNSFIVLEGKKGMVLVDQHTAHERVLYERFLAEKEKKSVEAQSLLFPLTLEFTKGEALLLESMADELEALGFEVESFGGNSVLVRSVPSLLSDKDCKLILRDVLDRAALLGKGASLEELAGDIIAVMACHAAVRAGQSLKREEMLSLMEKLQATNRPFTCPHGRPIALFFEMAQIKKSFLR